MGTNHLAFLISYYNPTVQYTQSGIHRPKLLNKIVIYLLFYLLLDPDPEQ